MPSSPFDEPDFVAPQNMVEIRTLDDAMKLLDAWIAAYAELRTAWARAEHRLSMVRLDLESSNALRDHLDPYLPRWLQDENKRAANERLYSALAEYRRDDYAP